MLATSFSGSEGGLDNSVDSERSVIQRMLVEEMSFSNSDNSQDLSGELLSEEEYYGPMDLPSQYTLQLRPQGAVGAYTG